MTYISIYHMYILVRCRVTCSKFMSCLRIHCTLQLQQQWSNGQASRREADVNKSGGESGRRGEGGVRGSRSLNGTHTNGNTDSIRIHQCQPIYAHIKNAVCQWQTQRLRRATHTHTHAHTLAHACSNTWRTKGATYDVGFRCGCAKLRYKSRTWQHQTRRRSKTHAAKKHLAVAGEGWG